MTSEVNGRKPKVQKFKEIEQPKLKFKEKFSYGLGDLGNGLMFDMGQIYLLKFYTDILGISAFYGGLVFLISKIFDAFVDTGVGTIVDTRKNIGPKVKFRPFILYGTLPLAIMTVITFLSPNLGDTGKIIWAFATYMLFNLAYSVVNIPYGSLSASMTLNADDRTQLSVFRNLGSQGAIFIAGIVVVPMVDIFDNHALGYPVVVALLAGVGVLLHIICYKNVKERHVIVDNKEEEKAKRNDDTNAFMNVVKNGAFAALATFTLLSIMAMFLKQSSQLYYFQYVLNEPNLVGLVSALNFIMLIPGLLLTTFLSKKFDKKMTAVIGLGGFVIFEFLNYFIFGEHYISFLIANTLSNFFLVIPTTVSWAFIADVVEYGQWKTGKRTEGIIYSSYSFTRKVSQALAGFVPGLALTMIGYQPNVAQSAGTLEGLKILFFVIPGIISLVALIIFALTYPLTDKRHKQIVKELTLRDEL